MEKENAEDVTYKIVRMFRDRDRPSEVLATGLTLEEAQTWCRDPETSWRTCTRGDRIAITERHGPWFDAYTKEE